MSIAFESDGGSQSGKQLLIRGIGFLVVLALVVAVMIAKADGVFDSAVEVTAVLTSVGDGLPASSDVKYQGVLVGSVKRVTPSADGGPNYVHIDLFPGSAQGIPDTVTARVVPSNIFAVPSVQLVDNGRGPSLAAGARIPEDRSLATVQLQTSLTALSQIAAAAGRSGTDPTVGILATVAEATNGSGEDALRAGSELIGIVEALNAEIAPDGSASTLSALAVAVTGLRSSAPDLLTAVHHAVVPLRSVVQQKQQLDDLLTGSLVTSGTVATALRNRTGTIIGITGKMSPVLAVLADGGRGFVQMTTSETRLASRFALLWDAKTQRLWGRVIVELTPHRSYTRADCPRYGALAGPSCTTDPIVGPAVVGNDAVNDAREDSLLEGNVGPVGSADEQRRVAALFGGPPGAASDLLAGPLIRGNDVSVTPVTPGYAGGRR